MLESLIVVVRAVKSVLRGHRELVLENLALRQQLAAYHERRDAASGRATDFFWMALARIWRNWRTALVFVQPDTVVRWHRDWLRRRWARRSKRRHFIVWRRERRHARSRRRITDPPPPRHRHVCRGPRPGLRVLDRQPRSPFEIRHERGSPFRIARESRFIGGPAEQRHRARVALGKGFAHVLHHHPRVAAVPLAVV